MRFAYADPPYHGVSKKFYGKLHPEAAAYDRLETHRELIERLCDEFPDGWALHMASTNLRELLPLCPPEARVCSWVKGFACFHRGVSLHYAWEPVVLMGGRKRKRFHCVRDWLQENMALQKGLRGAKPARVVHWILAMLNAQPDDEIVDLFPGSGSVTAAIEQWRRQPSIFGARETDISGPKTLSLPL